jgi:hypothetical protein
MKSMTSHENARNGATYFGVISVAGNCGLVSAPTWLGVAFKGVLYA